MLKTFVLSPTYQTSVEGSLGDLDEIVKNLIMKSKLAPQKNFN